MRDDEPGRPFPEIHGEELLRLLLTEIEEEEELSQALGVDLTPPAPSVNQAPLVRGPLRVWLERSEEIHRYREDAWRAERGHTGR